MVPADPEKTRIQQKMPQDIFVPDNSPTTPASTPAPTQTTPIAIIKPLSIEIPRSHPQQLKSKLQIFNYFNQLQSYNKLLKIKEMYLNNLLFHSNPQALRIFNSFNQPNMCSIDCISFNCNNSSCLNKIFNKSPKINDSDPPTIANTPIQSPPACEVFNDCIVSINKQPLNDLEQPPSPPNIKIEPMSPDISTLQISDPSPSSPNLDPPFIADYTPEKYPLFHISPLEVSPTIPSYEI